MAGNARLCLPSRTVRYVSTCIYSVCTVCVRYVLKQSTVYIETIQAIVRDCCDACQDYSEVVRQYILLCACICTCTFIH